MRQSRITTVTPSRAVEGGRVHIRPGLPLDRSRPPEVRLGDRKARVVFASSQQIDVLVPSGLPEGDGRVPIAVDGHVETGAVVEVGGQVADELHQIDNPVFDRHGNLYLTYSGSRGEQVPVSIFRLRPSGEQEPFSRQVVNPTSMALDPAGKLYVSSRFEGTVYRLDEDGSAEPFVTDLGIPCGLAFAADGTLFVGDRSGTIFRVTPDGRARAFAALPSSVAAFHLALAPDGTLYVTGPTLASYDVLYSIDPAGRVSIRSQAFGRPQGVAFDPSGVLHVVEALAGASGVYRVLERGEPELAVSGNSLIGLAFRTDGTMVVCSGERAYLFQ